MCVRAFISINICQSVGKKAYQTLLAKKNFFPLSCLFVLISAKWGQKGLKRESQSQEHQHRTNRLLPGFYQREVSVGEDGEVSRA